MIFVVGNVPRSDVPDWACDAVGAAVLHYQREFRGHGDVELLGLYT